MYAEINGSLSTKAKFDYACYIKPNKVLSSNVCKQLSKETFPKAEKNDKLASNKNLSRKIIWQLGTILLHAQKVIIL